MNERVRAYSYLYPMAHHDVSQFWTNAEWNAESAADLVARGYTAVKVDPRPLYHARGHNLP